MITIGQKGLIGTTRANLGGSMGGEAKDRSNKDAIGSLETTKLCTSSKNVEFIRKDLHLCHNLRH